MGPRRTGHRTVLVFIPCPFPHSVIFAILTRGLLLMHLTGWVSLACHHRRQQQHTSAPRFRLPPSPRPAPSHPGPFSPSLAIVDAHPDLHRQLHCCRRNRQVAGESHFSKSITGTMFPNGRNSFSQLAARGVDRRREIGDNGTSTTARWPERDSSEREPRRRYVQRKLQRP